VPGGWANISFNRVQRGYAMMIGSSSFTSVYVTNPSINSAASACLLWRRWPLFIIELQNTGTTGFEHKNLILNQLVTGYCPNKPLIECSSRSTLKNAEIG
jgi:hypothetical protein